MRGLLWPIPEHISCTALALSRGPWRSDSNIAPKGVFRRHAEGYTWICAAPSGPKMLIDLALMEDEIDHPMPE
jgi:hypothetical protein